MRSRTLIGGLTLGVLVFGGLKLRDTDLAISQQRTRHDPYTPPPFEVVDRDNRGARIVMEMPSLKQTAQFALFWKSQMAQRAKGDRHATFLFHSRCAERANYWFARLVAKDGEPSELIWAPWRKPISEDRLCIWAERSAAGYAAVNESNDLDDFDRIHKEVAAKYGMTPQELSDLRLELELARAEEQTYPLVALLD